MDARAALRSSATGCGRGRSGWVGPFREWCSVLVVVIPVSGVLVAAVHVVDMVAVLHGFVAAVGAMGVLGGGVLSVNVLLGHAGSFRIRGEESCAAESAAWGSRTWMRASAITWVTWRSTRW